MVGPLLVSKAADWPDCDFHCTAKDVVLTSAYAVVPAGTCEVGLPTTVEIWGVFDANATRYAVWLQADVYQDGVSLERIEQCLLDTIPRGTTNVLLGFFEWECGTPLELRDVIVSWTAKQESCADPPSCQERRAKCSRPTLGIISVETPLVVEISSDAPKCAGEDVHFESLVSGGTSPYSHAWEFGDGGGGVDARPSHVYSEAGDYTTRVIVTDTRGQRAEASTDVPVLPCFYRLTLSATVGGKVITPGEGEFRYPADSAVPLETEADPCHRFDGWTGDLDLLDAPSEASATVVLTRDAYLEAVFVPFDEEPPFVYCPPDATVECDESTEPDDTGWAMAIDDCDPSPAVSYSDTESPEDCPGEANLVRLWIAEDASGNVARCEQRIAIVDTTPPITRDDFVTTPEDTPIVVNVLDNDSDLCSAGLFVVSVAEPIYGTARLLGDAVQYQPPSGVDFKGTVTFSYVVRDCSGNSALGLVEVEVTPVNDPPVAQDQTRVTDEDTPTGFFSLAVTDPDNTLDEIICDCVIPPQNGSVARGANHTVNYTPNPDFAGTDVFVYEVCDPDGLCDTATVTIVVTSENDNPTVSTDYQVTTEDIPVYIPVVHVDPDGDLLVCMASDPAHGVVVPSMMTITAPYPRTDWLTYTPDPDFHGTDNFVITCDDGNGGSDAVLVEVTVFSVNDPPVARDETRTTMEDRSTGFFSLDIADPDNTLTEIVCDCVEPPAHGTVERGPDHTVNYTPDQDFAGTDRFFYEVCDPDGLCATATVTVEVTPMDDPPVAGGDQASTKQSVAVTIDVLANDFGTDNPLDPSTVIVLGRPSAGRTSVDPASGEITYIPRARATGIDTFLYQVCDSAGLCDVATVTVEVTPVPCGEKVEFDRRLSGEKTGQHKAPPTSLIEMTLSITVSSPLENIELVEFFPDGWSVANAGDGVVDPDAHTIVWEIDTIADTVSRSYRIFSPQKTLPPTSYFFHTELRTNTCFERSADWRVIVADPVVPVIGGCIDDVTGRTNNCTANDVGVVNLYILETTDGCVSYDDTACVLMKAEVIATAVARYDIGLFWALDGGDARTGTCAHDYLLPPLAPPSSYEPDGGPYLNLDGDACGDIEQGVPTFYYLSEYCVPCTDINSDGTVDIGHCVSWDNRASVNCATVDDTVPSTKAKCNCDRSETNPPLLAPNLTLSKSCVPSQVYPDTRTTCTITITNIGAGNATLISYRDDYDQAKGSVSSISNAGTDDGDVITWDIGTILAGDTVVLSYDYTVNPGIPRGTLITNLVTTYWNDIPQPQTASATIEVLGYMPVINVVKSGPASAHVDDAITYTYEVTNDNVTGDGSPISNVAVSDDVAGGANYVSGDTNTNGLLEVGETWVYEADYIIQTTDPDPLVNTGTASGEDGKGDPVSDTDTHSLDILKPALALTKTATDGANEITETHVGDTITYLFELENTGDADLTSVTLTDTTGVCDATPVRQPDNPGNDDNVLEPGEVWVYTCDHVVLATDADPLTNSASGSGTDNLGQTVTDDDSASVDILKPAILLTKTATDGVNEITEVHVGDTISYVFEVENTGDADLTNVSLTDTAGICDATPARGIDNPGDNDNVLEPGEVWVYECSHVVLATDADPLTNTATASGTDNLGQTVSDTDEATVDILKPAILLTKTVTDGVNEITETHVGDTVTYVFEVENTGDANLTNVSLTDTTGICDATPVRQPDNPGNDDNILEPGEIWVYTCDHVVLATDADPLTNTATASGTDNLGQTVSDDDSASVDILKPAILLTKTVTDGVNEITETHVGDTITYLFELENTGDADLTSVTLTDTTGVCDATPVRQPDNPGNDDNVLEPGEVWVYTCSHVVLATDVDPLTNSASASGTDSLGQTVTDDDSASVDILKPAILLTKTATDGVNEITEVHVGDTISYVFEVENTGDADLTSVTLTDTTGICDATPVRGTDNPGNDDNILEPGEIWVYTCSHVVLATDADPLTNSASASGTDSLGQTVSDTDTATVDVINPAIDIEKSTNGEDADTTPGPYISVGGTVTWTYVVTNTGDVTLTDVVVSDDQRVTVSCPKTTLLADESMSCSASGTATVGQYGNIGTVSGTPPVGPDVTDSDPSHYFGSQPGIDITKGPDQTIVSGGTATFTITVTNTGNVALTNVTVTDALAPDCAKTFAGLAVGASESYTCTVTNVTADFTNSATATGTPPVGPAVSDTDTATVDVINPAIDIEKSTNGEDADTTPGPYISVGGTVTWTYVVTNTGDVTLTDVVVSDDQGVAVSCPKTTLLAGESMTCSASGTATAGQYGNIGTVRGTPPVGPDVTDSDPSHYFGELTASIGDFVWNDLDRDGIQDPGEPGVQGITVTLYDSTGTQVGSPTATDANGFYSFTELEPGDYYVIFSNLSAGYQFSPQDQGSDDALDSDADPATGRTTTTTLDPGENDFDWDAGINQQIIDVELTKVVDTPVTNIGSTVTFTITVENKGPDVATNVDVTDVVPSGFTYVAGSISGGDSRYDAGAPTLRWTINSLTVGVSVRLSVEATVNASGDYKNVAQVTAHTETDSDSAPNNDDGDQGEDDEDFATLTPTIAPGGPALVTEKSVVEIIRGWESVDEPVEPGDVVTFALTVQNVGTDTAYNVDILDELPEEFEYLSGSSSADWPLGLDVQDPLGEVGPSLFWDTSATLQPGEILTLTFKVLISLAVEDGRTYTNVMYTSGVDSDGIPIPTDQSPIVPEDTDPFDSSELRLLARVPSAALRELPCKTVQATADRIWFQTDIAMYAASEFELLEELSITRSLAADTLLSTWIRTVRTEVEEYAFDNLIQVNSASQVGLSLAYGPRVLENAEKRGIVPELALQEVLSDYADLAELDPEERPENERWIFAEYAGGDPRYSERTDDIWPGGSWPVYDRRIVPSALGMGLVKQVMEAQGLLARGTPLDRYLALVLSEVMVNKLLLLDAELALERPEEGIRYFAHVYEPRLDGEGRPTRYQVIDTAGHLFDQVALLWGLSEFIEWTDPGTSKLFGEGKPFGVEYREIALRLIDEVFEAILTLHRDEGGHLWDVSNGIPSTRDGGNSWDVNHKLDVDGSSTVNLGLFMIALERTKVTLEAKASEVEQLLEEYAEKLLQRQVSNGGFADVLDVQGELTPAKTLAAQMSAIRGLLIAHEQTGENLYLSAAYAAFDYLEELFWDEILGVYASWLDGMGREYCYTPFEVGLVVGALRELTLVSEPERAELILDRLSHFFRAVVDKAALQLSNAVLSGDHREERCCAIFHGNGLGEIAPLTMVGAPLGVAPVLQQRLCLDVPVSPGSCCGLRAEIEPWFQTDVAMYAAYELQEIAPLVEDYADANLASLTLHSGMGIPLAQEEVTAYAELAGLTEIPELTPLVLEFYSGSPRLRSPDDLTWNSATFDTRIVGSAIGMTLLREIQEAEQLLAENHAGRFGRTKEENFYGLLLVGAIQSKLAFLDDLSQDMLDQTDTPYIPHAIRVLAHDGQLLYELVDSRSLLFDQLALLWSLSEAYGFVTDSRYETLFGPRKPFPLATPELVARLAEMVLTSLLELHFDPDASALLDNFTSSAEGWRRGEEITTRNLGLAIAALESITRNMTGRPELREKALDLIRNEVEFLTHKLADGSGGYFERYVRVDEDWRPDTTESRSLAGQLSAIRGLLVAYDLFDDEGYLALAQAAFDFLETAFWDRVLTCCEAMELYRNSLGAEVSCYTPLELGLAVGALERLAGASDSVRAELIRKRLWTLFDRVADGARLQLPWRAWTFSLDLETKAEYFASVVARRVCFVTVCK